MSQKDFAKYICNCTAELYSSLYKCLLSDNEMFESIGQKKYNFSLEIHKSGYLPVCKHQSSPECPK